MFLTDITDLYSESLGTREVPLRVRDNTEEPATCGGNLHRRRLPSLVDAYRSSEVEECPVSVKTLDTSLESGRPYLPQTW